MAETATVRPGTDSTSALDSVAWRAVQEAVRSYRRARLRGERPPIEDFADGAGPHRAALLAELIHEEMELAAAAGEPLDLAASLRRFSEVAADPALVRDLAEAEAELRRRAEGNGSTSTLDVPQDGPPGAAPPPPARIGRYELGEVIGRGAFGVVHRAFDTTLRRTVALKRPRPGTVESPEAVVRFLRESRAVAGLRHPNIVAVHDAGEADGELYLVGELIEGRDLADELAARRPSFRRSAGWVAALADALHHAHAQGLVHRDVKPSNVLIDARDRPYLTDFGLARADGGEATLTADGQVIGTPAYMAPEQAEGGRRSVDHRADVYGLGAILYELLTGSRPFAGAGAMLLARIREEDPRPPRRLDPAIPRDLETICLKCLSKAPGDRYATAGALADDLRRHLDGRPILARPVPWWERAARWARRRPGTAALSAICAASAVGLVVLWLRAIDRDRQHSLSMLRAADAHAEAMRREAESTRRHLYAVEVDRASDAYLAAHGEEARRILDRQRPRPGEADLRGFEWDYLWRLCDRDRVLRGHDGRINDIKFSPDGRVLASGGNDRTVRLWRVEDWSPMAVLDGHDGTALALAFSPDGRALYSGGGAGTIRRWDGRAGRPIDVPWRGGGAILTLTASPDGATLAFFATSGDPDRRDSRLRFLDLKTRAVAECPTMPTAPTNSLAYTPDGRTLAEAHTLDRDVRLWDAIGRRLRGRLPGHGGDVLGVAFSPDGSRLASGGMDQTVRVWDLATGRELGRQPADTSPEVPALSPDGRTVAFCDVGGILLWDVDARRVRRITSTHMGVIRSLAFHPRGDVLASAGTDGTIRLWDVAAGRPLARPSAGPAGPEVWELDEAAGYTDGLAVSPDGRSIAVGGFAGWIEVRDARTGAVRFRIPAETKAVRDLAYSPDGRTLHAALNLQTGEAAIRLFGADDGRLLRELVEPAGPPHAAWSLATTPDARLVALGEGTLGRPGRVVVWDAATGAVRSVLGDHPDYVRGVAISPDGRTLASGGGADVRLWDLETGSPTATLEGHRGQVFDVAFDPTGRWLASASEDQTVRLWDVAGRREVDVLRGHTGPIQSVAFSPDGTRLASGGREGHILLWDVATRRRLGRLTGHAMRLNRVKFLPDGTALASTSFDRTIRLWRGDPAGRSSGR